MARLKIPLVLLETMKILRKILLPSVSICYSIILLSFYASLESLDSLIHDRLSAQGIADRFEEIQCELQFHVFQFINIENVARDRTVYVENVSNL